MNKIKIIATCIIEKEIKDFEKETIQNIIEEFHDAPIGQYFDKQNIILREINQKTLD